MAERKGPPPSSGPPSRNMMMGPGRIVADGARKEKMRQRAFGRHAAAELNRSGFASAAPRPRPYVELRTASAFSFLEGASLPEDLVERASALGLSAVALVDRNGVYGAPRFYKAAKAAGVRALVGAEVTLDPHAVARETVGAGPLGLVPPPRRPGEALPRLTFLVESRAGYKNLCRLITAGARGKPKGEGFVTWDDVAAHGEGLHVLTGGEASLVEAALVSGGLDAARKHLDRLAALFPGRVHVELQRHHVREEEHRNSALTELAARLRLPYLATNGVRYSASREKDLFDVLTCIRHHTHLDAAGRILEAGRERHLKCAAGMATLFADLPGVLERSAELAARLDFTLADLGYRFPDYPLPSGETPISYLRHLAWEGARARFRPLTARAQAQIEKELLLIEKLDLAGYFLIVWDVIAFCRKEGILVQGRGSAANSAVCYALSITAIDPVKMELLFERFLSEERGEWPDIDLDLPSGDRREKVIQHVYRTYGPHGAAMTANVITYRDRSAARETAKALGFSPEQVDTLAKRLGSFSFGEYRDAVDELEAAYASEMLAAGFDPEDLRIKHLGRLFREVQNLPRHLGQHSGGMVVAKGRLDEVVPLEPAAMEGRVVIQWDKDDCADLGIVKVDLLGLGMLGAIEEMLPAIKTHENVDVDLAHLPQDDPKVYEILNAADTVGLFQVESRAQMASLPRNAPRCFYDIVVQVAIIRPGPIVGGMVHPFFDRRQGKAKVVYPHPSLEPILARTLGVPLFQEQLLKIAMVAAGFTGGEAEELRRAMGFKRSVERMATIEKRLRDGMTARGIVGAAQEEIVKSITSFALYGFPESHAASFALIAYASAWLKVHHPAAFTACLLNAWPMGFYHPATIVKDAERHGTRVLPIDVSRSNWKCRLERLPVVGGVADATSPAPPRRVVGEVADGPLAVRLGLRFVRGLRQSSGETIEREAARAPFASVKDLSLRTGLRGDELTKLAEVGGLSLPRRTALWQVAEVARDLGPLFDTLPPEAGSPLTEMTAFEETVADYEGTGMTAGPHLVTHFRPLLRSLSVESAADLSLRKDGDWVKAGGAVIVRQRPGTAKGFVFLSIEDETGIVQAIIRPDLFREHRALIVGSPGLVVEGRLQKKDGTLSVKAERFAKLPAAPPAIPSHDFH